MKAIIRSANAEELSVEPVEARCQISDVDVSFRRSDQSELFAAAPYVDNNSHQRFTSMPYRHDEMLPHLDPVADASSHRTGIRGSGNAAARKRKGDDSHQSIHNAYLNRSDDIILLSPQRLHLNR